MDHIDLVLRDENISMGIEGIATSGWQNLINSQKPLPNKFVSASKGHFQQQFYWDSFFIMLGLKEGGREEHQLAKGIVENFFFMLDEYGYIPNSYHRHDTRSQPPYLTSMIIIVDSLYKDKKWLEKAYGYAKKEYKRVWLSEPHLTDTGLSRYFDLVGRKGIDVDAENESGWDMTPRFNERASKICPIDLNSNLYKYEKDLAEMARRLGKMNEAVQWEEKAKRRKELMNHYMWDEEKRLFFDYDMELEKRVDTRTLAIYSTMWSRLADDCQAKMLVSNLELFEHAGGLATCDYDYGCSDKQWNYPNGWAPLQFIAISGLRNYGFHGIADRLAFKWLKLCADDYARDGSWAEKYCVVEGLKRTDDNRYGHQEITGWTIGIFIALYSEIKRRAI